MAMAMFICVTSRGYLSRAGREIPIDSAGSDMA